ncbi:MAG: hypothetical protein ACR2LX_13720 [Jatrophihabitans sp.]
MSDVRSGPLAAWARSWLAGVVSLDQVVDAVTGDDETHEVAGLVEFGHVALQDLLLAWRHAGAPRFVLPVAGDIRGLPGPAHVRADALRAGGAVVIGVIGQPGYSAVPEVTDYSPSSRLTTVRWQVRATESVPADHLAVGDAQYDLTTAIRESAAALASADVARWRPDVADSLSGARRAGERVNLPPSYPPGAVALLAQAERLQAVLDLALADPIGGAVDRAGIASRSDALAPLATAVRRARVAAYNATNSD